MLKADMKISAFVLGKGAMRGLPGAIQVGAIGWWDLNKVLKYCCQVSIMVGLILLLGQ
ncbi:hypothetical protein [Pseudomonas viridiflava]|uniref:hypothetical protein n=1 Tax=Pseudomonas viridiflava TaxID=33069 RepID=UPI0013DEACE0|nr:hypothetical protein [Pseudomonas viridiflava]MEE4232509.1 hypothetical protein [Pseudomonas viridiflava]